MSDENGNTEVSATTENVKKLDVIETLRDGVEISVKNISPILVNLILWILTIWIPYFNVGTTIGLFVGIVAKASREETISFTEIFDPKYRKYMGDFFLTIGLVFAGTFIGIIFLIIPGIIISLAWSFALLFVIDKGKNPTEAITLSNNVTYGYKGRMFLINFIASLIFSVIQTVLSGFDNSFASFLVIITVIFQIFVALGIEASMYKQLAENV